MMAAQPTSAARSTVITGLALLLLTLAAYWPALNAGYIWDDDDYLTQNALVQQWDGLARIWQPMQTRQYYPLVFTTFWIEHKLWGIEPAGYHFVNVLLYAISAMLVWRIARWLGLPGAFFIAAVFALHPVHVESVAWITERKNTLSGVFYLTAMLSYLKFDARRREGQSEWWRYGLVLACFAAALLSKTVTASLPVAIVIILLMKRERLSIARLWPLVPMLVMGLVLGLNTAHVERVNVGAVGPEFDFTFVERCLIASRALLFYPVKLVLPWPLCFFYPRWDIDVGEAMHYVPIAVVLVIGVLLMWLWRRGVRWPACAALFYAVTIFPALGFVSVYPMKYSFVADHFQYLASLGVIAGVVAPLAWLLRHRAWRWAPAAIVLATLGVLTFRQTFNYRNEETLWRATIDCNPQAWAAMNNLGAVLLRKGEQFIVAGSDAAAHEALVEAQTTLHKALQLKPDHSRARSQLSETLRVQGRLDEALTQMEQSHADLMASIAWMNREQRAQASFEIAESHYQLARLFNLLDRHAEAEAHYRAAISEYPRFHTAALEMAQLLAAEGRLDDAADTYRILLSLAPEALTAHRFLGDYERDLGHCSAAVAHYRAVFEHAEDPAEQLRAMDRAARVLATCNDDAARDGAAAVQLAERVVGATQRQAVFPLATLAMAYAELRDFERAVATAEEAIALAQQLGMSEAANEIKPQLEAYRAGRPWRIRDASSRSD
jgi:tetratricopeptide (TPR) repeat protein